MSQPIPYRSFILSAFKITCFCLLIVGILKLIGSAEDAILVVFTMAVMSSAATFSSEKTSLSDALLGSSTLVFSIIAAGLCGFYAPELAKVLSIVYAGLAFLLPKTKNKKNIFVTGAVIFLIFVAQPFGLKIGFEYLFKGMIVIFLMTLFTWLDNLKVSSHKEHPIAAETVGNTINALTVVSALILAWVVSYQLTLHTSISHLYWIGLTVLVILQGSDHKNIKIAVQRILVNFTGAVIIVVLFNYVVPASFWINFAMLVLFLFLIFALGFSYIGRTLFIELFVLGFAHLLGAYHDVVAIDRVLLTAIGGLLVIFTTLFFYLFERK